MSTEEIASNPQQPDALLLSLREIALLVLQRNGIHEGMFDLKVEFQIGTGGVGPDASNVSPGLIASVSRVGITASVNPNPSSIDASVLNPAKKETKSKKR